MGGQGPGHRSVRAVEARLKNIQKARAARKRAPLPWRSGLESRIIEQLVWQWWVQSSGQWTGVSGQKRQQQVPHRHPATTAGWVRDDSLGQRDSASRAGAASSAPTKATGSGQWSVKSARNGAARPWAKYRVARFLGVSHTWVNKLVKRFEKDPDRMRRRMAAFAPASIEKLEQAREETRWERERGRLRGPIRYRRVKVTLEGKKRKVMVRTRKNEQQIPATAGRPHTTTFIDVPLSRQTGQSVRNDRVILAYREVPEWAKGLLLPGDAGMSAGRRTGTPRPVPFAFRRRR